MVKAKQTSDSIELGILLALSGGIMDAYSYMARGEVFANAQTGNMLLFGIYLSSGKWGEALWYFCPIIAFMIGIMIADIVRVKGNTRLHWRQLSVFVEAVILLVVSFIPLHRNLLANSLTSLACGIQVESFRKIHGHGIATTMCIGNLRSATQNMCDFVAKKDTQNLRNVLLYFGIIFCFVLGAILGNTAIHLVGQYAIIFSVVILLIAFAFMFIDREEQP